MNNIDISRQIKDFYSYYIIENTKLKPKEEFNKDTLKTYCTASFIDRTFNDPNTDEDPLLMVQDYNLHMKKTLSVTKINSEYNKYNVCYVESYDNTTHCIRVTIQIINGKWKIDNTELVK